MRVISDSAPPDPRGRQHRDAFVAESGPEGTHGVQAVLRLNAVDCDRRPNP
jgi:hypothetical protein